MKFDIYQAVTDKIIAQLEKGTVPWHRPWSAAVGGTDFPRSMSTGKHYRGVNTFLLGVAAMDAGYSSPWWGTYKNIASKGGQVRKGESGTLVVFWKQLLIEEEVNGQKKKKRIPMLRYFKVFNADQADGLPEKYRAVEKPAVDFDPMEACENIVEGYQNRPLIFKRGAKAFYSPSNDEITVPVPESFDSPECYYATLFHEMTHSTGHPSRLARSNLMEFHHFGDEAYSKEELVAEMGAAMLCAFGGIEQQALTSNTAAYLKSWLDVLKGDAKMVVQAAGMAQKATDHILGITWDNQTEEEE